MLLRLVVLLELQVDAGEGARRLRGVFLAVHLERGAERRLQALDRLRRLVEHQVQAAEVVQQAADVALVVQLLVVRLRPLRVVPGEHPVAHPLGDERRLKVDVRHRPPIVEGVGELERALHVLAGGLEVALPAVAPGAPAEDVGAEQVTRKVGAVREGERLVEEADRRRDARELVTAHAEAE